jgi:2-methylcitrate dehydratase PrpD
VESVSALFNSKKANCISSNLGKAMRLNRRNLMSSGAALIAATASATRAQTQTATPVSEKPIDATEGEGYGAASRGLEITSKFARFISEMRYENLTPEAVHEAKRAVLDWLGCALAGSTHPTVEILFRTFKEFGSVPVSTVIGQGGRKLSLLDAAVANGQMGHVLDFDDTHLGGVILHTSTAALPALLALGEKRRTSGRDLIVGLTAAFEAGIRTGQAAPRHHRGGWHLTGTLGTVAAGVGAARLFGLDERKTVFALGAACTQAAGMQQNRGTDRKSLHAGKSAYNGVLAAMLASQGFNSNEEILEGSLGFTKVYSSSEQKNELITEGLGKSWKITGNGYKPYACGIVLHPLIDSMIEVSRESQIPASQLVQVQIKVHPDVVRITGVDNPGSGLMSKFSANHAASIGYIDRAAGMKQFAKERADDPAVQALRKIVKIQTVTSYRLDEAEATITTRSGAQHVKHVEHATGTVANPMTDAALQEKFLGNATSVITGARARKIAVTIWQLDKLKDVGDLVRACA